MSTVICPPGSMTARPLLPLGVTLNAGSRIETRSVTAPSNGSKNCNIGPPNTAAGSLSGANASKLFEPTTVTAKSLELGTYTIYVPSGENGACLCGLQGARARDSDSPAAPDKQ